MAPSGKGHNKNVVTEAIRIATWTFEVEKRAEVNTRAEISRAKLSKKLPAPVVPSYNIAYGQQYSKIFLKMDPQFFYPTYWLTFLILGFPAGEEGRTILGAGSILFLIKF